MNERLLILLGVVAVVVVLILAVMRLAFRVESAGDGLTYTPFERPVYTEEDVLPPPADSIDDGNSDDWWAIGALSDIRRRVAGGDAPPLEEPITWLALLAGWDRVKLLGTRRPPADVGPHGGTGWAWANHAHQDGRYLDQDGRYLAEVPA